MNILFVCTGNTCRSSMAEGMLKAMLKEEGLEGINVSSAGLAAISGEPASPPAVRVLREIGIDLTGHKAAALNAEMLRNADLILTMTKGHKLAVQSADPSVWQKIFTLKEYAQTGNTDITDPYGQSDERYRQSRDEIKAALRKIVEKLNNR